MIRISRWLQKTRWPTQYRLFCKDLHADLLARSSMHEPLHKELPTKLY